MPPVKYHMGKFPPATLNYELLLPLISKASGALGRYEGLLTAITNPSILLSPLTTQEAVLSSKMEGTNITMGEVLEIEAGIEKEGITQPKLDDAEEIINYRKALRACADVVSERPLTRTTIRQAHSVLMQGVRGKDKSPGKYRNDQNWIGKKGCNITDANFIPIAPEHLPAGMNAWGEYLTSDSVIDPLVQLAVAHVEFEALHPFKDGNGRLGRMLVPLFLFNKKILSHPSFYISEYLEKNRDGYIEKLRAVSSHDEWTEWCAFFIEAIRSQAVENEKKARAILNCYSLIKSQVSDITHSQHAWRAVDFLFEYPIFLTPTFIAASGIPKPTASRIVSLLQRHGIIQTLHQGRGRAPSVHCFADLLNIAEGRKVF